MSRLEVVSDPSGDYHLSLDCPKANLRSVRVAPLAGRRGDRRRAGLGQSAAMAMVEMRALAVNPAWPELARAGSFPTGSLRPQPAKPRMAFP